MSNLTGGSYIKVTVSCSFRSCVADHWNFLSLEQLQTFQVYNDCKDKCLQDLTMVSMVFN